MTLLDLFQGRRQLIVRHFMFAPEAKEGCVGCSMQADNVGNLSHMHARDTSFVMIARAPIEKIEQFKARMGWSHIPWVSSFGSDFNYDFNVSMEKGELPAVSSFIRDGEKIYHASSVFDRGGEVFINTYNYLDVTPLGRQEEGLAHPWDWWRHHDRYDSDEAANPGENWWTGSTSSGCARTARPPSRRRPARSDAGAVGRRRPTRRGGRFPAGRRGPSPGSRPPPCARRRACVAAPRGRAAQVTVTLCRGVGGGAAAGARRGMPPSIRRAAADGEPASTVKVTSIRSGVSSSRSVCWLTVSAPTTGCAMS